MDALAHPMPHRRFSSSLYPILRDTQPDLCAELTAFAASGTHPCGCKGTDHRALLRALGFNTGLLAKLLGLKPVTISNSLPLWRQMRMVNAAPLACNVRARLLSDRVAALWLL